MTKRIEINTTPREKICVALGGKEYLITPPKAIQSLRVAAKASEANEMETVEVLLDWVRDTFSPSQSKDILARLESPKDDLDFPDLTEMFKQILEAHGGGNPTT